MNEFLISLLIILYSFITGIFDCFIPVPIPSGIILSGFFIVLDNLFVMVILCGFFLSLSSTLSLFLLRKIFKKKRDRDSIWISRLNVLYNHLGYYSVFLGSSFLLITWVTYTFLFVRDLNYKKYFISLLCGRTLILFAYTFLARVYFYPFFALLIVMFYVITVLIFVNIIKKNGSIRADLVKCDENYALNCDYDLSKSKFYKFNKKK